ncbi:MAG: GNAT family N-acetyltransferase [Fimbriimonas sp.]|nr:GNAT family N-acetyltransferase [Fimbriimonas sp.]
MKRSFQSADFDRLAYFWNGFAPEKYWIDGEQLRLNTVDSPAFDWGASCILEGDGEILGFVSVKKAASKLYKGPDKDVAHLSMIAYCESQYGVDLMAEVKRLLANRGCTRLQFGQDTRHFFPGCPTDFHALTSFLTVEGFLAGGEAVDLERDMTDYVNAYPVPDGDEMRVVEQADLPALNEFFDREFPGRWKYDTSKKVEIEGPRCVYGLFIGGRLEGFALIQDSSNKAPIGGAVWHKSLGKNWGALGAIGVAKHLRGRGSGIALLASALEEQKARGVERCIIDWTGLIDFYGKVGFVPTRRYTSMSLSLGD